MKTLKLAFALLTVVFLFTQCKYDFIVPEEDIDPTEEVSFAEEILPIFQSKCTGCHNTGGTRPDLTAGNAFNSLQSTRYINESAPEESLIYTRPHPTNTDSHPDYSENEAALVLVWIQQGANNN